MSRCIHVAGMAALLTALLWAGEIGGILKARAIAGETAPGAAAEKEGGGVIAKIRGSLGCDSELLTGLATPAEVMEKYRELLERGRAEGFTPVIIIPGPYLPDAFELHEESGSAGRAAAIAATIDKAESINPEAFLAERKAEFADELPEITGVYEKSEPAHDFIATVDYRTKSPYPKFIVAKLPTAKPWEAAAWIPMGGYNECPSPEEQVAVFKYWHAKYGAVPAVVSHDIWQLYVEKPPRTGEEAEKLALDQFAFCSDIVFQGMDTINALAGVLTDSPTWYFWWD